MTTATVQENNHSQMVKKEGLALFFCLSLPLLYNFPGLQGCRSCMKMKLLHLFSSDGGFCIKHFSV